MADSQKISLLRHVPIKLSKIKKNLKTAKEKRLVTYDGKSVIGFLNRNLSNQKRARWIKVLKETTAKREYPCLTKFSYRNEEEIKTFPGKS